MEIGMVGLGKMGGNMARRLLQAGHSVVVHDRKETSTTALAREGAVAAISMEELAEKLSQPRAVWVMVPAGNPTEEMLNRLSVVLAAGDTIIDGGNSNYRDSMRRASELGRKGITLLDVGVSGGVWGLHEGYCLMAGGDEGVYRRLKPLFRSLAPSDNRGYGRVGPSGAGHFVKMVHNGIEYGLMEAYAEGFELMGAKTEFDLDLGGIADIWQYGSVVRSWLLELVVAALREDPHLEQLESYVMDSGEGRWTIQESLDLSVPLPAITLSLQTRFRSRQEQPFAGRLLAALRQQFGGHSVKRAGD